MCRLGINCLFIFLVLIFSQSLWAQEYNPVPKDATDGILTDWGRIAVTWLDQGEPGTWRT